MTLIYRWWWAVFAAVYPLIFVPSERGFWGSNYAYHITFTAVFVLGAALYEWFAHPHLRLRDIRLLPQVLGQHKPMLFALLFALWGVLAAFFTPVPVVALTGASYVKYGDGALGTLLFVLAAVLVYLQTCRDPGALERAALGVVASGLVLSVGSVIEIAQGKGLIFAPLSPAALPMVSFLQKGHLAGYLVATLGVALAFWLRKPNWPFLLTCLTIAFALGLTHNRSAFLGLAAVLLVAVWRSPRLGLWAAGLTTLAVLAGIGWTQARGVGGQKELASTRSMQARLLFWKAAWGGILERPVWGWGGGNFDYYWPLFLSPSEQELFLRLEAGVYRMIGYISPPGTMPVWAVENEKGRRHTLSVVLWKSHSQLLEVALQRGLVGLGLYLALLASSLPAFLRLTPGATGLWAYHVFLLPWFITFFSEGVLWVLFALAAAEGKWALRGVVSGHTASVRKTST